MHRALAIEGTSCTIYDKYTIAETGVLAFMGSQPKNVPCQVNATLVISVWKDG